MSAIMATDIEVCEGWRLRTHPYLVAHQTGSVFLREQDAEDYLAAWLPIGEKRCGSPIDPADASMERVRILAEPVAETAFLSECGVPDGVPVVKVKVFWKEDNGESYVDLPTEDELDNIGLANYSVCHAYLRGSGKACYVDSSSEIDAFVSAFFWKDNDRLDEILDRLTSVLQALAFAEAA